MTTQTNLLAFMTDAPEGTYQVTKPTDEQLAAVLPWLIDSTITYARKQQLCGYVNTALPAIIGHLGGSTKVVKFYAANGRDCEGYDKDGFNADGFNAEGYDKDGYSYRGRDRNGFNREGLDRYGFNREGYDGNGRDRNGLTREEAAAKLVGGWSRTYLDIVAVKLAERAAVKAAAETQAATTTTEAETETPVEELASTTA
jgi:hypothetical protein